MTIPVDQIESEQEEIWINFDDDTGLDYSEIEDFQSDVDVLYVQIAPESVKGDLNVEVTQSDNSLDSLVLIEYQLVAILKGAPDATIANVVVTIGTSGR